MPAEDSKVAVDFPDNASIKRITFDLGESAQSRHGAPGQIIIEVRDGVKLGSQLHKIVDDLNREDGGRHVLGGGEQYHIDTIAVKDMAATGKTVIAKLVQAGLLTPEPEAARAFKGLDQIERIQGGITEESRGTTSGRRF